MDLSEYRQRFAGEDAAPGWDSIDGRLAEIYGDQVPRHWGTDVHTRAHFSGPNLLDGFSAYECQDGGIPHLHFCTFGYSSLYYDEESVGGEYSGYGFEMTFRLASRLPPVADSTWVCELLQTMGRWVHQTGRWLEPYQWCDAKSPIGPDPTSQIHGIVCLPDPILRPVDSPHGKVEFLQVFGVTRDELDRYDHIRQNAEVLINLHRRSNPLLVTDFTRTSSCEGNVGPAASP